MSEDKCPSCGAKEKNFPVFTNYDSGTVYEKGTIIQRFICGSTATKSPTGKIVKVNEFEQCLRNQNAQLKEMNTKLQNYLFAIGEVAVSCFDDRIVGIVDRILNGYSLSRKELKSTLEEIDAYPKITKIIKKKVNDR